MQFTVKVDFFTDIITNSSSVVYSQASGVETMFAFLNDVIKEFGVDKKAEDIFDITIEDDENIEWSEYDNDYDSNYIISTKNGNDTKLGRKVANLFGHEGAYEG